MEAGETFILLRCSAFASNIRWRTVTFPPTTMLSTLLLKSRSARSTLLAVAALLCCSGSFLISQTPSAAPAQIRPAPTNLTQSPVQPPAATNSPTHPEDQPPLDVDRDPIPSPDADVNAPPTSSPNSRNHRQLTGRADYCISDFAGIVFAPEPPRGRRSVSGHGNRMMWPYLRGNSQGRDTKAPGLAPESWA
jgi:hypothetical protein